MKILLYVHSVLVIPHLHALISRNLLKQIHESLIVIDTWIIAKVG